jgi:hypothetical protein
MAGLNNSIFDLPSSIEELRRPEDVIKVQTRKVNPTSTSKLGNFPGSDIVFNFTLSGNQHWIPSRSYVVIRNSLFFGIGGIAAQPVLASNVAPSCNMPGNLFNGCSLTVGGFSLGSISQNASQISVCQKRLQKSAGYLDGAGKSISFFQPRQLDRQAVVCSDGIDTGLTVPTATARCNENESVYQPPLGIFKWGKSLGNGRYELTLSPKSDIIYKQSAIESTGADVVVNSGTVTGGDPLTNGEGEFQVNDITFYVCVVDNFERNPSSYSVVLDLEETNVIPRDIAGGAASTENYTVSKSTFALSCALQDKRAGTNTLYSPSAFKTEADSQNSLTNLQIAYAGENRPSPAANPQFAAPVDHMTHRYLETGIEDLALYDTGGMLTKEQWRELGELYHFQWRKSGDDISTNVDVSTTYGAFTNGPHRLLLFHHFRRIIEYSVENGQVTSFLAQDA